jgi:hypothetical protein
MRKGEEKWAGSGRVDMSMLAVEILEIPDDLVGYPEGLADTIRAIGQGDGWKGEENSTSKSN